MRMTCDITRPGVGLCAEKQTLEWIVSAIYLDKRLQIADEFITETFHLRKEFFVKHTDPVHFGKGF